MPLQVITGNKMQAQQIFNAGAGHLGNGLRGIWLIFVYWSTIGLAVMILGAHQFYLKVAANAAANPDSALTIGELISKRDEFRALLGLQKVLRTGQEKAALDLERRRLSLDNAYANAKEAERKAQILAQRLVRGVLTSRCAKICAFLSASLALA